MIRSKLTFGTRLRMDGSAAEASKSLPGTMPISASFGSIGASAAAGGLVFRSSASSLK